MSLIRALFTVGSMTLLSRVTGFARDMMIAAFVGAGAASDAFFVAFKFPNLFRRLFAEGAFSAAFVPIFAQVEAASGRAAALAFANRAAGVLTIALLLFCSAVMVAMPWLMPWLAPGFDAVPGKTELATDLARTAFPYLLFISLVSLQSGVLNALDRFAAAAFAPVLLNLTLIAALLVATAGRVDPVQALAWGVPAAGIIQFGWLYLSGRRAGVRLNMFRPALTPEVRDMLRRMAPVVLGASLYQISLLIDTILASLVSDGAVSWLYYADRMNQLPLGVVGVAIGVALLPKLSRAIGDGRAEEAHGQQNRAVEVCLLFTVPAAVGLMVLAGPITATLFERGAFTVADRLAVAPALVALASGLPAYVLIKALAPGFFARSDTRTPVIVSTIAMGINLVLNLILMGPMGHVGLATATAIAAWINAASLGVLLIRRGWWLPDRRLIVRAGWMIGLVLLMAGGLMAALRWLDPADLYTPVEAARAGLLAVLIGGGAALYGAGVVAAGIARPRDLRALLTRRA